MPDAPSLFEPAAPLSMAKGDPNDSFVGDHLATRAGKRDVTLFGLPFDGAVTGRPGARFGPDAIRGELRKLKPAPGAPPRLRDLGNARMPRDARKAGETAEKGMREALATSSFAVALGGDHSLTHGLAKAAHAERGALGLINIDAHLDIRDVQADLTSGTPFRRIIDDRIVPAERIVEIGLRPFANSPHYVERARRDGMGLHFSPDVTEARAKDVAREAVKQALSGGAKGLYVSLDVDALDESCAPGVSAPTPGGLDTRTLYALLDEIARHAPVVALDVMEVAPPYDRDGMTSRAAAYAIMTVLAARRGGH